MSVVLDLRNEGTILQVMQRLREQAAVALISDAGNICSFMVLNLFSGCTNF